MLAPDEKLKLSPKPYLSATAHFASGADTPRDFLERCLADLALLEPKIGAFVNLNLAGARAAADQSTARWRTGRPRSAIDGMPIGIKDIIETADMSTENAAAVRRFRPNATPRGGTLRRRGHRRQSRDHRIRLDRAARHAQSA
jgi:Asp-tRNA(Asn)/Glu-tRNA(Gln) amidotransferase A subunit family amidase